MAVQTRRRLPGAGLLGGAVERRRLLGWLGLGLLVRCALMPLAVSADFLAVYWRSHLIAYHAELFDSYLVNMGAHYLHAASLRLLDVGLAPSEEIWTHPWWWADSSALAPQVLRTFSARPDVYRTLFLLKLPYLAADLGAGAGLLALLSGADARLRRRAFAFWMLSPIGLYASYVFSRYEAFPVVLVVLALLCVERDRPWLGALALGAAVTVRGYPLLLVPLFGFVAVRGLRRQALWAGLALAPFALVLTSNRVLAGTVGELARLRDFSTGETFFAFALPVGADEGALYLFFLAAFLLWGVVAGRSLGWWGGGPIPPGELWLWLLVFHAAMFGLATFSAHYFMWLTPFVALALARRPQWRGTLWLHLAQVGVVLALADLLGGSVLNVLGPLDPRLADTLPSLREALLTVPDSARQLAGVLRTGFLALTVLLICPVLGELARRPRAASGA